MISQAQIELTNKELVYINQDNKSLEESELTPQFIDSIHVEIQKKKN